MVGLIGVHGSLCVRARDTGGEERDAEQESSKFHVFHEGRPWLSCSGHSARSRTLRTKEITTCFGAQLRYATIFTGALYPTALGLASYWWSPLGNNILRVAAVGGST